MQKWLDDDDYDYYDDDDDDDDDILMHWTHNNGKSFVDERFIRT